MATIGATALTLLDHAKRMEPDGQIAKIVELLSQSNPLLTDALFVEGNLPTGHRTTVRTGIPTGTWRRYNVGVQPEKSTTVQVTDTCGQLSTYSVVDKSLADLNGNSASFLMTEEMAFVEGLGQTVEENMIYGNEAVNVERFTGLAARYNTVNPATAQTGNNVVDAGGTGSDNTSIWLVVWGDQTCHGIFPKGQVAGLQRTYKGIETVADATGGLYEAHRTYFEWNVGMSVRDWRYIVRIANIDVSDLAGATPPNLINLMIRAMNKVPNLRAGSPVFYCNRAVKTWLDIQGTNKTNGAFGVREVYGEELTTFRGIPIRMSDRILNTEARVV